MKYVMPDNHKVFKIDNIKLKIGFGSKYVYAKYIDVGTNQKIRRKYDLEKYPEAYKKIVKFYSIMVDMWDGLSNYQKEVELNYILKWLLEYDVNWRYQK